MNAATRACAPSGMAWDGINWPDVQHQAWFRKRCFWVTQASGIVLLFKAELVSNTM